jgi:hypothetical protein
MTEVDLIEKAALRAGMKSLMNHGAASCVYSEGCNGVTQEHLIAFAREVALHCVVALPAASVPDAVAMGALELMRDAFEAWDEDRDSKVGKILLALTGGNKGYDRRSDAWTAAISAATGARA